MQYVACVPLADAPAVSPCPAGTTLQVVQNSPGLIPTPADIELAGYGFGFVIFAYLIGSGLGMLLRIFRDAR